jgi:hypothetical protein
MRDAVTLEARGIPTVILVNDVFAPIAHATASLLELPPDYVAANVVWLPHPTSNLTAQAAATLIDERIGLVRSALIGRALVAPPEKRDALDRSPLEAARKIVDELARSLHADGAELVLLAFENGVLSGELRIGDTTCEGGACIIPAEQLSKMIDAMVRPTVPALTSVALLETRALPETTT